jgi:polyhydroxyalkanoate synthesis regulator phasin
MPENNVMMFLQQGLRTVVGATAEAIETLQDPEKRTQAIAEFNEEWQKKSQKWEEKGSITETEARKIIENFFQSRSNTNSSSSSPQEIPIESESKSDNLNELTEEIISLRKELEKLNSSSK